MAPINRLTQWPEGGRLNPQDHPAAAHPMVEDADQGRLRFEDGRDKLAIVGFASSTRDQAPFDDPSWIIAGMNQLYRFLPRADLWVEVHDDFLVDQVPGTDYLGWLQRAGIPILMPRRHPEIPLSCRFPLEAAIELAGDVFAPDGQRRPLDYYQSSIPYLIAWGLLHGVKEIGIWGVDLTVGEEYGYQKPNAEFWLGFCQGRGVRLTMPPECALLKQIGSRYGALDHNEIVKGRELDRMCDRRQAFLREQMDKVRTRMAEDARTLEQMEAAFAETALWKHVHELRSRGTQTEYCDSAQSTSTSTGEVWGCRT